MSFDYYPGGAFGILASKIFPKELLEQMHDAYSAAERQDEELIAADFDEDGVALYPERYQSVMKHSNFADFESNPGELVRLAFAVECEKYIPGYRKMIRYSSFYRVPRDAMGTGRDADPGDLIYGIGVYQLPLEKYFKRAKVPQEFCSKANLFMWVVGG